MSLALARNGGTPSKVVISKVLPHKRAQIIYKYQDPKYRNLHDAWLPWVIEGGLVMFVGILALLLVARLKKNAEDERAAKKTE